MNGNRTLTPQTVVYTAESQIRTPLALLAAIWRDIIASRELSWRLFVRDLSAQYRQSLLGIVWAFIPPIVTSLIFVVLQSRSVVNFGNVDVPYPLYVMVGTIVWQVFVESFNAPLKALTAAKPMLAKINFPREALLVAAFYQMLYGVLTKMVVIVGVLLVFHVPLGWSLPAALAPMLVLVLVGMCAGLLLTPVGMLYSDVATGLPVFTQLLFFVTPVVYAPPDSFPFSLIKVVNPVSPLLMTARDLLIKGTLTSLGPTALVTGVTLVGLVVGLTIYRMAIPILIERTSA